MSNVIEIEVAGDNRNLAFAPLDRVLRGELDFQKIKEPTARLKSDRFPTPIPGVRLGLDTKTGEGYVNDPLYDDAHSVTREQIEKSFRLGPKRETFEHVHVPTWLDRMIRACDSGTARLVRGEFPSKLPGKPIQRFLTMDLPTRQDQTDAVLDKLGTVLDRLATVLDKSNAWDDEKE